MLKVKFEKPILNNNKFTFFYPKNLKKLLSPQALKKLKKYFFLYSLIKIIFYAYTRIFIELSKPNTLELVNLSAFLGKKETTRFILFPKVSRKYKQPLLVSESKFADKALKNSDFYDRTPNVYLGEISDAKVIGNSNFIIKGKKAIHHDLLSLSNEIVPEEAHNIFQLKPFLFGKIAIQLNTYKFSSLNVAATFVDGTARNYAHWITEVLPRVSAFSKNREFKNIPMIFNEGLHRNIIKSLDLLLGGRHPVIFLPQNHGLIVKKLFVVSVAGYAPFDTRKRLFSKYKQPRMLFNSNALQYIRSYFKPSKIAQSLPDKIYIARRSSYRNLLNDREIEALVLSHGFVVYNFMNEPFERQVNIISNANIIIGNSGAHFANLLFAKPSAKVIILTNSSKFINFQYWTKICFFLKNRITYVIGNSLQPGSEISPHADFSINLKLLDMVILNNLKKTDVNYKYKKKP